MATRSKEAAPQPAPIIYQPSELLTPDELAARLKVPRSWIYNQLRPRVENPLPVVRMGHHLRFHWPDICAWLQKRAA